MIMQSILSSASKIVFIMMALGVNLALFLGRITGDQYLMLAGMSFTFYFSNKQSSDDQGKPTFGGK